MSDTLRINNEMNQRIMEPIKTAVGNTFSMAEFLMRNDKQPGQTEITGGNWDSIRGVYTTKDATNGITSEYKVKKSMITESGFAVYEKSFKEITDESGKPKRVQVEFDPNANEWVKRNSFKKAADMLPVSQMGEAVRPKLMGTLVEQKNTDGASTFTLRIEKAKYKPALK